MLVFCADPLDPRIPDPAFEREVAASETLGIGYALIEYEALVGYGDARAAVRRISARTEPERAVYRGWMLAPDLYTQLYEALAARGVQLINDSTAYTHCHYLPEWYPLAEAYTPRSVWTTDRDAPIERIMEILRPFGPVPVIVKDFVKSRKHEWEEACYIPSAADQSAVERVVRRFVELQGEELSGGLVFREFVEFEALGMHPKSGMPLTREYRLFFLDGEPLSVAEYWGEADYPEGSYPPLDHFRAVAGSVESRFFAMDVARRSDGEWLIVELGDGQVSGLPERADILAFYQSLTSRLDALG
jgi:hypothetical protein